MPLSVISADINFNATRDLQFLNRFQRATLWRDLYFNPVKSAVGMFISEFLNAYIRQSPPDPRLWDFVMGAIATLDSSDSDRLTANFHLAFLIDFLHFAGIRPDLTDWREDAWFDMRGHRDTYASASPRHRNPGHDANAAHIGAHEPAHRRRVPLQQNRAPRTSRRPASLLFLAFSGIGQPQVAGNPFGVIPVITDPFRSNSCISCRCRRDMDRYVPPWDRP